MFAPPSPFRFVLALLTVLALFPPAVGADDPVADDAADQPATRIDMGPAQRAQAGALIADALAKTGTVRIAVERGQLDAAYRGLADAHLLLDLVRSALPTGETRALMRYVRTQLELEDNQEVLSDLLVVYAALNAMPSSLAAQRARNELDAVKAALEKPDRASAAKALERMQRLLVIDGVDLPVDAAAEKVREAMDQMQGGKHAPEDATLVEVQSNLMQALRAFQ